MTASSRPHRVFLVRHAKAEKDNPRGDSARRLTEEGRDRFRHFLTDLGPRVRPTRILTSPLERARETAEILAAAAGAPVEQEPRLASGRSTGHEILRLAERAGDGTALVGHNPELGEAIALAAGSAQEVKPGAVAALDLLPGGFRLAWIRMPAKEK